MIYKSIYKLVIATVAIFATTASYSIEYSEDDIVGQWKMVVKNPAHKNTVSKRYMRHTFFPDGKLVIENKVDSEEKKRWEIVDGRVVVTSSYKTSKFIEYYELRSLDKLAKTRFKSIIDGKPLADYDPKEFLIRQGSSTEQKMKKQDIFGSVSSAMDFIDPNTLEVGSSYILSKKTPVMPSYLPSDLSSMTYANKGQSIRITAQKKVRNIIWYQVESKAGDGWVNSTALFGQQLK